MDAMTNTRCYGSCGITAGHFVTMSPGDTEGTVISFGGYTGHVLTVKLAHSGSVIDIPCSSVIDVVGMEHGKGTWVQDLGCNCTVCRYDCAVQVR